MQPMPAELSAEGVGGPMVAGHGVVGEMSSHHARQPPSLLEDGQMPASHELILHLLQLRPQPLRSGDALEPEAPVSPLPADVREAEKVERLRLGESPFRSVLRCIAPELDQPGLLGMQLQVELRKPFTKVVEELFCITTMLGPDDEVVDLCRCRHKSA
jgi:hypothetical protein